MFIRQSIRPLIRRWILPAYGLAVLGVIAIVDCADCPDLLSAVINGEFTDADLECGWLASAFS